MWQAAPRLSRRPLRLAKPVSWLLLHLPCPPIAAVVRAVARPVPAQAALVPAISMQASGLRLRVSRDCCQDQRSPPWPSPQKQRRVFFQRFFRPGQFLPDCPSIRGNRFGGSHRDGAIHAMVARRRQPGDGSSYFWNCTPQRLGYRRHADDLFDQLLLAFVLPRSKWAVAGHSLVAQGQKSLTFVQESSYPPCHGMIWTRLFPECDQGRN